MQHTVRLDDDVADAELRQDRIDSGMERGLGQPEALRFASEEAAVLVETDANLRADAGLLRREQRQESVRRGRSEDLHVAALVQLAKRVHEVAGVGLDESPPRP